MSDDAKAEACETCRFQAGRHDPYDNSVQCRRYPPKNEKHPRGGVNTIWLRVFASDWCGEYQPKKDTPDD